MNRIAAMVSVILLSVVTFSLFASIPVGATDAGSSSAQDINDVVQVVGNRYFVARVAHAFLWQVGTFEDRGTIEHMGGANVAVGSSKVTQMVGQTSHTA